MISHVWTPSSFWTPPFPLLPGSGGTETFTLGQCRELTRRGIDNQVVTFRLGEQDGRSQAPDVRFTGYPTPGDVGLLEGEVVLATEPLRLSTSRVPHVMMHNLPLVGRDLAFYREGYAGHRLLAPSSAAARGWADFLDLSPGEIGIVHPFAGVEFANEPEPEREPGPVRVLFAGRLGPEKGIYTLFEALHSFAGDGDFAFTVVLAGDQDAAYALAEPLVRAHPMIEAVAPRTSAREMARLLVTQDVLVMPSHSTLWIEPFGTLSAEAQHAGCRVVASDLGGLPESDCGGLVLCRPDDPLALARAVRRAGALGRLTPAERRAAARQRTAAHSVDELLTALTSGLPALA
ncbi:glycosyltransferase family 4 protein [Streptomyces clavuligerus]|uniref:glycosyltransferase family 4 protein n=1 Tax=Streptomyces clavuligerus TaxID=1901 RepID=UPI0002FF9281|nr:glycosyltransferase family 4 protein [Streptomyces clavuligerus]WDN56362.1 glycosyltransferase family 4 protein [Streptomyces clavuligerus]